MKVFTVLFVNLKAPDDTMLFGVYAKLDDAFSDVFTKIKNLEGNELIVHNYTIGGCMTSNARVSNNNSIGSEYGISYKSYYGQYPCAYIILERELK